MTTREQALARIEEEIRAHEQILKKLFPNRKEIPKNYASIERNLKSWLTHKAVLELQGAPDIGTVTGIEDAINHGRNLALQDVQDLIIKGGGGWGMSEKVETCFICADPTGRAGAGEDSLYIGSIGPFDEKCWEIIKTHFLSQLREGVEKKIERAEKIRRERKSRRADTTVQDCKIDAWQSVLALIEKAEKE